MNNTVNNSIALFRDESGSILMETVIVIPLFMLLIGGIMWSGQLMYDKQKLVIADRYVAWNCGNRYAKNYNDVQDRFFLGSQNTKDVVQTIDPKINGVSSPWWHEVHGSVALVSQVPSLTVGWFTMSEYVDAAVGGVGKLPSFLALHGRDLADGSAGWHTVVMRKNVTPDDTRSKSVNPDDSNLSIDPGAIYSEPWPEQAQNQ